MTASILDQNFLLGFLALQNDFISREELITSVSIWLQDKSRSLQDIFDQRGVLQDKESRVLQSLVEVHLAKHGGDVEKTLTGLPCSPAVRADLARLGDGQLENTLTFRSWSTQAVDSPDPETTTGGTTGIQSRFSVLRTHARGGLGEVFVARDEELNRERIFTCLGSDGYSNDTQKTGFLQIELGRLHNLASHRDPLIRSESNI